MEAFDLALVGCYGENLDAVFRCNSCARIINSRPDVRPEDSDTSESLLDAYD
jgi:hypothetical protein